MKTLHVTALLILTFLLGLSVVACAQDVDGIVATVPFDFVAEGVNFPAGEYRINRVSSNLNRELVIHSYSNGGLFLITMVFDGVPTDQPTLSFEHIGDRYCLIKIETSGATMA